MTQAAWLRIRRSVFDLHIRQTAKHQHRKWRLFGAACCRRVLERIDDRRLDPVIEAAESFADGLVTWEQVKIARKLLTQIRQRTTQKRIAIQVRTLNGAVDACDEASHRLPSHALEADRHAANVIAAFGRSGTAVNGFAEYVRPSNMAKELAHDRETREQVLLARDIFGNPFRPVTFDPAWRTSDSTGIAKKMYADRNFSAMPILADALEEAVCDNVDILLHCREPGTHVRGCWVVDLVLDKK